MALMTPNFDFKRENVNNEMLEINVIAIGEDEIEFQMIGWSEAVLNSIRRSILAEVLTVSLDRFEIKVNSSIVWDEMLAQRLGLIPIRVNPQVFDYKAIEPEKCFVFNMNVKCDANTNLMTVYSKDLKWVPLGNREVMEKDAPTPIPDIEITKLIPGQAIELNAFCSKGCGREHAKFNPAANVCFKPMVVIDLIAPVQGELAYKLKALFDSGVEVKSVKGVDTAFVKNPLSCRNYWKVSEDEQLKKLVKSSFDRKHFIFTAEGVGFMPAKIMVEEGIKAVRDRFKLLLEALSDA